MELLCVISIVSTLFIFSCYGFKKVFDLQKSETQKHTVLNAIQLAKMQAIALGTPLRLCGSNDLKTCSKDWKHYLMIFNNQLIFSFPLEKEAELHYRIFPIRKHYLEFLPNGWLNSENGTIWYCSSSYATPAWAIVLNKAGRPRLVMPDKTGKIQDEKGKAFLCN